MLLAGYLKCKCFWLSRKEIQLEKKEKILKRELLEVQQQLYRIL